MSATFESALADRVAAMADACTQCGKCFEVCPITEAGRHRGRRAAAGARPAWSTSCAGRGNEAARKWASACLLSGECIKACDYGVNPRFMLAMARTSMARSNHEPREGRKIGVEGFRKVARDVSAHLAHAARRCSCWRGSARSRRAEPPPATSAAGLRVLHRLQRAQDPAHRAARARHHGYARRHLSGDGRAEPLLRRGADAHRRRRDLGPLLRSHHGQARRGARPGRWCRGARAATSQFTETTLPTVEKVRGAKPFEMTPFMLYLRSISTGCGRILRGGSTCGWRCTSIPAFTAW